jgi:integrase
MSRIRLRYVQQWVDGDGRIHRYFRRPGYPRVRLSGLPGSAEFMAAYQAALDSTPIPIGTTRSKPGSVAAAVASYYASSAFRDLAPPTQAARRSALEPFRRQHGDKPIGLMPRKFIEAMLDTMTAATAQGWRKALRALMQHCIRLELVREDPTLGIRLRPIRSEGHHTWTEDEIAQYEEHHPIGSKARLALALGLYTAQRRGDCIGMGPQHVRNGMLRVKQQKTRAVLTIPVHPGLQVVLDAAPGGHLTFLTTPGGKPYSARGFTQWFARMCAVAGLPPRCTFHGLRKAACRRLAEAGCSANEIAAISGHRTLKEIARYTQAADQERLARNAMARNVDATSAVKDDQFLTIQPDKSLSGLRIKR